MRGLIGEWSSDSVSLSAWLFCFPPCVSLTLSMCVLFVCILIAFFCYWRAVQSMMLCFKWLASPLLSITHSCGHGWRSCRRNCWMMCTQSQWKQFRTWSSVLANSSRPPCRLLSMSSRRGRTSYNSSGDKLLHRTCCIIYSTVSHT